MSLSSILEQLTKSQSELREVEMELSRGVFQSHIPFVLVRHEIVEAQEAIDRALDTLHEAYRTAS
jgi:hypothetical protein